MARRLTGRPLEPGPVNGGAKSRAAAVSIASNCTLVVLKLTAGVVTGSVAILTDAVHSGIDLLASVVAYVSVRKADAPADESHLYGHHKLENLAAAIEGVLILVGSGVIVFEATRRLAQGAHVGPLWFGIAVIATSLVVNVVVSGYVGRQARAHDSPALEGDATHLRADAATSLGVLVALVLVELTGAVWLDPTAALVVAVAIVAAGVRILTRSSRVLVDEALPAEELDAVRAVVRAFGPQGVVGFHALRARRAGAHRHIDMHVQFRAGTTLEDAHATAHELKDSIGERIGNADVLIHLEPADKVRPGTEVPSSGGVEG